MASKATSSKAASKTIIVPKEIIQEGKVFIRITGEDRRPVFVSPDVFRGQICVNIREFFIDDTIVDYSSENTDTEQEAKEEKEPFFKATKKGVNLTEGEFNSLVNCVPRVQTILKRLKRKQAKVLAAQQQRRTDAARNLVKIPLIPE